ncbi:MAG TPA: hypothetical protein DIT64_02655 [Verrucomicrobiales bacterium]|nr:hypothetical protein [Verrucomicrobiales bacterium]
MNPSSPLIFVAFLTILVAPLCAAENAEPSGGSPIERWFMQDYMLGDWGGLRSDLSDHGVDLEFFYVGSVPNNISGGIRHGAIYQSGMILALDLDFEKMGLWKGGSFHASSVWLNGQPFSDQYVGDLNKTNLVDFPADFRVWQVYFQQHLLDEKLTLKAGLLSVDRDFILPEMYNSLASINFLNQTFFFPTMAFNLYDQPFFPKGAHSLPSTPYGVPAVVLKWDASQSLYLKAGVYDGYPDKTGPGTRIQLHSDEGALFFYELGWRRNMEQGAKGLPTSVKAGGYYHTDEFYDIYNTIASLIPLGLSNGPTTHDGNYGLYLLAERMLWREQGPDDPAQQGVTGFFRTAWAPRDRNIAEYSIDGGLVFKGLIPGRDYDTLGIAGSYMRMSRDLERAVEDINKVLGFQFAEPHDYEAVVELSYKLQLAAWWTLSPNLQYVMHPGGSGAIPNAWVFALQTTLRF